MVEDIILSIKEMNWSGVCYPNDDWVAITRVVSQNGVVQTHIQRTLSGMNYSGVTSISSERFEELLELLKEFRDKSKQDTNKCCDGIGYEIKVYEDSSEQYTYTGYIHNNTYLKTLVKIVCGH